MENCAQKLLESATHRTLHAHAFSRASTQATVVLTDLLSRYLALLSSTCADYAQHAGRGKMTVYDALEALEEMGTSLEDLAGYAGGEGKELNRYALHSARRAEELNEFRGQLVEGLRQDRDDAIPLVYAPDNGEYQSSEDEDESESSESEEPNDVSMDLDDSTEESQTGTRERILNGLGNVHIDDDAIMPMDVDLPPSQPQQKRRRPTPPLPLSPISNKSPSLPPSPSQSPKKKKNAAHTTRKRPRTATWSPPEYVPDFLPPFPSSDSSSSAAAAAVPVPASASTSTIPDSAQVSPRHLPSSSSYSGQPTGTVLNDDDDKAASTALPTLTTSGASAGTTSTSDILVQIPYSQSTLSSLSAHHLPGPPPRSSSSSHAPTTNTAPSSSSNSLSLSTTNLNPPPPTTTTTTTPIPQIEPSFIAGYHYILTHPPPAHAPPSTLQRHRVAITLLNLIQANPRWTTADSLYGSIGPCNPRVAAPSPSFPVGVGDLGADGRVKDMLGGGGGGGGGGRFPGQTSTRAVCGGERMAGLVGEPAGRLGDLARRVVHPTILNRTTRLVHPPVLYRGSKPLVYGPGVPAPWNSNPIPFPAAGSNNTHPTSTSSSSSAAALDYPPPHTPVTPHASGSGTLRRGSLLARGGGGGGGGGNKDNNNNNNDEEWTPYPKDKSEREREREREREDKRDKEAGGKGGKAQAIPDALLFATWEYEGRDFRGGLPGSGLGSGGGAAGGRGMGMGMGIGRRTGGGGGVGSLVIGGRKGGVK